MPTFNMYFGRAQEIVLQPPMLVLCAWNGILKPLALLDIDDWYKNLLLALHSFLQTSAHLHCTSECHYIALLNAGFCFSVQRGLWCMVNQGRHARCRSRLAVSPYSFLLCGIDNRPEPGKHILFGSVFLLWYNSVLRSGRLVHLRYREGGVLKFCCKYWIIVDLSRIVLAATPAAAGQCGVAANTAWDCYCTPPTAGICQEGIIDNLD